MAKFKDKNLAWIQATKAWMQICGSRLISEQEKEFAKEQLTSLLEQDLDIFDEDGTGLWTLFIWMDSEQGDE